MLKAQIQITDQDARSVLTGTLLTGNEAVGQIAYTTDGRQYSYGISGATALAPGKLTIGAQATANHVQQTGTANAIGSTSITFTVGATAVTANQYAHGYLAVDVVGPNLYKVKNNTVSAGSAPVTITLAVDEGLTVATTTSSKFGLYPNPFANTVIEDHTNPTNEVSGVPNIAVPAASGYWSQVGGYATLLQNGNIAKNTGIVPSSTTDGAVDTEASGTIVERIGYVPYLGISTQYSPTVLSISGLATA